MGLPKTLPPKSATAICAAVTEPWPVGVDPGPLMSVSTPILTTSSETCASAAVEASIARASAASMGKHLLSILSPPVAFDATVAMTRPGPLGHSVPDARQIQRPAAWRSPAAGSGSSAGADAGGSQVQRFVKLVGAMASSPFQCLLRLRQRLPPIHDERLTRDKACLFRG